MLRRIAWFASIVWLGAEVDDGRAVTAVDPVSIPGGASLAEMRVAYTAPEFDEDALAPTWHEQLLRWLTDAIEAELPEPNAMVLATADDESRPSTRTVLAKTIDPGGVVFFTNFTSNKMTEMKVSRFASATFPWMAIQRQVHIRGPIELLSVAETKEYWVTRPRDSQLGAWASPQSAVVSSRRALDLSLEHMTQHFAATEEVPPPPHWGGVRIVPESVEFWQGRPSRMHDRLRFDLTEDGEWTVHRLAP